MKFLYLEDVHKIWNDILVIGKTIKRDNKKYHIIGMTLADEAKLYIIEPYSESGNYSNKIKGVRNQRKILKGNIENDVRKDTYLHCSEFYLGNQRLQVRSGSGGSLKYDTDNYETIQVFLNMLDAGWQIPEWLKNEEWDDLQLVTLVIEDMTKLPQYSPEMPIIIKHGPNSIRHILEKTITLNVGKSCPKGMCYIGIEYECSKDISLQFYSKEFLKSVPITHKGSSSFFMMSLKPDKEMGIHNFPLKSCVIQTAVSPDTAKIPAELFSYYEKVAEWEEKV